MLIEVEEFNVHCRSCGAVWTPGFRSPLWWQAKHSYETLPERLDVLHVSGKECGCVEPLSEPNAPYRVFGFTDDCQDFDVPFTSFTKAVRAYLKEYRAGLDVWIDGVSLDVRRRLDEIA